MHPKPQQPMKAISSYTHRFSTGSAILSALLLIVGLTACDDDFSPKADFVERVVVFSVLDRSASYQVVRLERTFDADGLDLGNKQTPDPVTEATVEVRTAGERHVFTDTLITLSDGSTRKVWINRDLRPVEGRVYTLTVDVPGFDRINATTQVPSRAFVQIQVIDGGVRLLAVENTAYPASGYYFRLWVSGKKTVDGVETEVRREVPFRLNSVTGKFEFPEPSRDKAVVFPNGNLLRAHSALQQEEGVSGREVVGEAYSLDQFFYSYYKLARGFDDPVSVRQDRPDISNIEGGVGIFGAVYPDSVIARFTSVVVQ
ncbi:MAG: DUF4249 family protein [Bacteroidetes bacterium]|nr:DUF4249 family protein [Bacteroidota bacterium]